MKITKKTKFGQLLKKHPEAAEVFWRQGMHCVDCPVADIETIEQGCQAHGIDTDELIKKLNDKISGRNK